MPRFLAIDVDANGLFVAAASLHKGAVAVEQVASRPSPPPLTADTAADLGRAIRELLTRSGIKPAPVLLCVGRDRVIPKDVRHPPTPPADEPAVVKFQAMKELSEAGDEVVLDYCPLPPTAAGDRRALVVFMRKDVLAAARTLCESAGLKLAGVTPRPFAAVAAFRNAATAGGAAPPSNPDEAVAVVTLGEAGGEFTVARAGHVAFTRTIPVTAMAQEKSLVAELRRNLTVYAGLPGAGPLAVVYLAEGAEPGRESTADRLGDLLPVAVRGFDPFAGSAVANAIPPAVRGGFAGVIGLLAAKAASDVLPINFASPRQPKAAASPHRSRVLVAALVGVLVLGVGAMAGMMELAKANRRVLAANNAKQDVEGELQKTELDAKRLAAADEFTNREVVWLDELYDLSDRFPDVKKMRAVEIEGTAVPPPAKTPAKGSPPAAAPKTPVKPPVGQLRVVVSTEDAALVDRLVDGLNRDKFYSSTSKSTAGLSAGSSRSQQFTVTTQIVHRGPAEYLRRLVAAPPPKAVEPPAEPEKEKSVTTDIPQASAGDVP